jgi:hypothetical protein
VASSKTAVIRTTAGFCEYTAGKRQRSATKKPHTTSEHSSTMLKPVRQASRALIGSPAPSQ